jgi:hypothetical protein
VYPDLPSKTNKSKIAFAKISLDAKNLKLGEYESTIKILTTDANHPEIILPVMANVLPDIEANPKTVFAGFVQAGEKIEMNVELLSYRGEITISEIYSSSECVKIIKLPETKVEKIKSFKFAVSIDHKRSEPGEHVEYVTVKINREPYELKIPVMWFRL